jgi:hypothetical protein
LRGSRVAGGGTFGRPSTLTSLRGAVRSCGLALFPLGTRCPLVLWAALEIRYIPTRTLQLKTSCRDLFGERRLGTLWAGAQGCIGQLLQNILGKAAGSAFIGINRHVNDWWRKSTIIVPRPLFTHSLTTWETIEARSSTKVRQKIRAPSLQKSRFMHPCRHAVCAHFLSWE